MGLQLTFLVRNTNDPDVLAYVAVNLQINQYAKHCAQLAVAAIRDDARNRLLLMGFGNPMGSPQTQLLRQKMVAKTLAPSSDLLKGAQADVLRQRKEDYLRLQQDFMKQQLQKAFVRRQKQQLELADIWRNLMKTDNAILIRKMRDADPVVCLLAVQVAGKKRLPVEKECITLLTSTNPTIRQAARQTLIRLGRSVDFGPEPAATPQQIAASVRSWTSWSALQTDEVVEESDDNGGK